MLGKVMYDPKKAACFFHFLCSETRLLHSERVTQGGSIVLNSTDGELLDEIKRYNIQAPDGLQLIGVAPDFLSRMRTDTKKLLEGRYDHF